MQLFVVVVHFKSLRSSVDVFLPVVAMLVKLLNLKFTHNFSFVYSQSQNVNCHNVTITRYLQIETIRFTYQELTRLCPNIPCKNNLFTYPCYILLAFKRILQTIPLQCIQCTKSLILKSLCTFHHDFIFSVIVYEHLSELEDDFELNKPSFLEKIIIFVSYNGKL
jgi:hypothetical protein